VSERKRIALLIDCDNVSHNAIEGVLEELAKYGTVNVRHAHGDWNSPSLSGWVELIGTRDLFLLLAVLKKPLAA